MRTTEGTNSSEPNFACSSSTGRSPCLSEATRSGPVTSPGDAPVIHGRVLALAGQKQLGARLGAAHALLVFIIEKCGSADLCVLTYQEAAVTLGVHRKTVQSYCDTLEKEKLIARTPRGPKGIEIRMNTGLIGFVDLHRKDDEARAEAKTLIEQGHRVATFFLQGAQRVLGECGGAL